MACVTTNNGVFLFFILYTCDFISEKIKILIVILKSIAVLPIELVFIVSTPTACAIHAKKAAVNNDMHEKSIGVFC